MSEELEENVAKGKVESKGFSITSMILGIISLVLFCIWYVSIPCAIIAIIFAILGKKKGGTGMAIAGLVLGIIALSLWVIMFVLAAIGLTAMGTEFTSLQEALEMSTY